MEFIVAAGHCVLIFGVAIQKTAFFQSNNLRYLTIHVMCIFDLQQQFSQASFSGYFY